MHVSGIKVFSLLALAIGLAACGKSPEKSTVTGDPFEGSDYAMSVPESWETRTQYMGSDFIALRPADEASAFRENVNVILENLPGDTSQDEYFTASIDSIRAMNEAGIVSQEMVKIGELDAMKIHYTLPFGDSILDNDAYILVEGKGAYIITLTMHQGESREKWLIPLTSIAKSFRITSQ